MANTHFIFLCQTLLWDGQYSLDGIRGSAEHGEASLPLQGRVPRANRVSLAPFRPPPHPPQRAGLMNVFQITYLLSRVPVTLRVRRFCTTKFSNSRLWQATSGETARCHTPRCDLPYPSALNQARPCPAMPFQGPGWVREGSAHARAHPRPAMPFQELGWVR